MLNVFLYLNKEEKWKQTTGQDEDENMKIIETYGNYIEKWSNENPGRARWLLKTGWKAQNLKFRFAPDKRLMPAEQYLARLMMDTMIRPLERPEESAIVSIFTPCEILQEAGLHPYNVEGFSCYLSASKAERAFLQQAENTGISETLCSYHKTFIGAAQKKVLPKPKCIVYTNLTCDANLLTFKKLAKMYDVPIFAIDVPMQQNEDNVQYVADQLRKLKDFIEECTGKKITDETLTEGKKLLIKGQFRSYNSFENERNKLILTVFAKDVEELKEAEEQEENDIVKKDETTNEVVLIGFVCKKPIYRQTPFGREIADLLLAVNRAYNKSDYIPTIAWGRNARFCQNLEVGAQVKIIGRVQSRQYEKKYEDGTSEMKVAYEVSICSLELINEEGTENKNNTENESQEAV